MFNDLYNTNVYYNNSNTKPTFFISTRLGQTKNRLKIYKNNIVYLNNNTEFQLEFENYTTDIYLAVIHLNGKPISNNGLVLKPGQHIYLDRFLDINKKFLFETYEVEVNNKDVDNAIKNNGKVEVYFYKQKSYKNDFIYYYYTNNYTDNTIYSYCSNSTQHPNAVNYSSKVKIKSLNNLDTIRSKSFNKLQDETKETGIVSEGSISGQQLTSTNYEFNTFHECFTEYTIKPISESKKIVRNYCVKCGSRIRIIDKWKFCPNCGYEL